MNKAIIIGLVVLLVGFVFVYVFYYKKSVVQESTEKLTEMVKIENMVLDPVLPVSVIGTKLDGQVNFMTASWFTRLEVDPYLFGVSIQKQHFTHKAIMKNKSFSINIPATDLIPQVDAVGMVSGKAYDKSNVFDVFFGEDKNVPMIKGSIISMECELVDTVSLVDKDEKHPRAHTLFIGKVKNVWANKDALNEEGLDFQTLKPIFWSWSPMTYWTIGEKAGKSFNAENRMLVLKKK